LRNRFPKSFKRSSGTNKITRTSAFRAIKGIEEQRSRNLVRGAIAGSSAITPSSDSINSIRKAANPADIALGIKILLGKDGAFPFPNIGGTYRNLLQKHSLKSVAPRSEVAFVAGHVNGWKDEARTILTAMAHFARIPENSPLDGMEAIAAFVDRYGASSYVVRKIAYVMSRYGDDANLQPAFQSIAKKLSQSKFPSPYFSAMELMDTDLSYFRGVSTRVQIYKKYVENDYRQYLPLHEMIPIPLSREDLAAHLRKSHSTSLVDELVSLICIVNLEECWPDLSKILLALLDKDLIASINEFAATTFNSRSLYADVDPLDADTVYYQRAAAFSEFKECALYRRFADVILAPRLMSGLVLSVDDCKTASRPEPSINDLTKVTQGFINPDDYLRAQSCGNFLRTVQVLRFLNDGRNYAFLSAHDLRFICEHTVALDILLAEVEIEALYASADEESRPLVTVLALALHKAKSRDEDVDFKFRYSLCQTVIKQFRGKLEDFIVWLLPKTPQIANYLLSILDRQTLQKLYWLIHSADEADRTRQSLLRAVGKQRNEIAFFIEADSIEAQRQVAKLRKFFDDSRIYVDGIAMKEWLVANPSTYAQQYIKMIEHDISPLKVVSASVEGGKVVFTEAKESAAALDYVLLEVAKLAYEQFCTNRQFGVESYLGRRIRHNTMKGMMRGGVEDLIDLPAYRVLSYDSDFVDANRQWIESYHRLIEHLRKDLLQFRSDTKPHGIFSSTLKQDENTHVGIGSLRNMVVAAPNVELMNELLIRFCWQEIDPQLQAASKMITVDMIKEVNESVDHHFAHFDDELQRGFKQQLREAVHERLMRLGSWFRQPEDGFVNATTRQLGELILVEARENNVFDNRSIVWSGEAVDMEIDGLSVHRMYDCLFVTLRNAIKYGEEDGPILIHVHPVAPAFESVCRISTAVSSQFGDARERAGHIARLAESFASGDPEAAMSIEGYSGIRKLRYITRTSEGIPTADYEVTNDICTVSFALTVELAHRERNQQ
jgi:hypothetical protein